MARQYEGQIAFIGVGGFDSEGGLERFVDRHELDHFPHAVTRDGELFVRFELSYHPAWVVIAPDGEVVLRGVRPSMSSVRDALDAIAGG